MLSNSWCLKFFTDLFKQLQKVFTISKHSFMSCYCINFLICFCLHFQVDTTNYQDFSFCWSAIPWLTNKKVSLFQMAESRGQKRSSGSIGVCIICQKNCYEDKSTTTAESWGTLLNHAKNWVGLAKFGTVYDEAQWENGPQVVCFHKL